MKAAAKTIVMSIGMIGSQMGILDDAPHVTQAEMHTMPKNEMNAIAIQDSARIPRTAMRISLISPKTSTEMIADMAI